MEYAALVDLYDRVAATDATLEKREILAEAFADAGALLDRLVVLVQGHLRPAHDRVELGISSSRALAAIRTATGAEEEAIRDQWRESGDLGDAAAWAVEHGGQQTLFSEALTVERVHDRLLEIASFAGEGSEGRRVDALAGLLSDAEPNEARYIIRTALGHLRLGVGEGLVRDAIADAFLDGSDDATAAVERAYQVTNDYQVVARTAREDGQEGLAELDLEIGRPIGVMLAEKAESLAAGLAAVGADTDGIRGHEESAGNTEIHCEVKYDGIRVQIHIDNDDVQLFTRRLQDVTEQFPDVVRAVDRGVDAERAILDGELVGYTPETVTDEVPVPAPFQSLSQRVKREYDVAALIKEVPVVVHLFDCLDDGASRLEVPLVERLERLDDTFEPVDPDPTAGVAGLQAAASRTASMTDSDPAEELYAEALEAGHEGLMLKDPTAAYEPGRRVGRLLKVKPTMEPLDLVVTRAMYSEGRRRDWLGRLYLACYDPANDAFREVGRLSTGYTDEELAALTDSLEELIVDRDGRSVNLQHEIVLEVAYEEIQESPEYDSGYALRFPRFEGIREDLDPTDADTLERVESLYESG